MNIRGNFFMKRCHVTANRLVRVARILKVGTVSISLFPAGLVLLAHRSLAVIIIDTVASGGAGKWKENIN